MGPQQMKPKPYKAYPLKLEENFTSNLMGKPKPGAVIKVMGDPTKYKGAGYTPKGMIKDFKADMLRDDLPEKWDKLAGLGKPKAWRPSRRAIHAAMEKWTPSAEAWMADKLAVIQMRRALIAAARVDGVRKGT